MKTVCLIFSVFASISAFAQPGDLLRFVDRPTVTMPELDKTLKVVCPQTTSKINASIRYISFTYETVNVAGQPTPASAALLIPLTGAAKFPLVSYQHGTTVERRLAPSSGRGGTEGRGVGTCYASQGSAVVVADYLGYGDSTEYHPYLHADSEAKVSADAIRAAKILIGNLQYKLSDKVFLAGYSQGGHSTMALHRLLESQPLAGVSITAVAPMAGPYDLSGTVFEGLQHPDPAASTEAAFIVSSFNNVYSIYPNLESMIRPQYTKAALTYLPGDLSFLDVMTLFPENPADLLQPSFLADLLKNPQSPFIAALRKNDLLDWTPVAPIMLIHGTTDIQVPTSNTVKAEKAFRNRGSKVQTVWIEGKDHEHAAPQAFTESIKWFNSFL